MKAFLTLCALSLITTVPSFAGVAVIGGLVRHHTVKPGEAFEGVILVKNTGTETMEIGFSQTDYLFAADGTNRYDKPGTHARSNALWLSVNPTSASVPPQETISVYYKGKAPASADLAGTYWSMIMIQPSATPLPQTEGETEKPTMRLQTVMRYALQVVTEIGAGTEQLAVLDKAIVAKESKPTLQLDVANTGQRVQIPTLWAELFNADGVSIGRFEGGKKRIYPDCSVRYSTDLEDVPAGKYTALIVLDSGGDYVTGAQYSLEIAP